MLPLVSAMAWAGSIGTEACTVFVEPDGDDSADGSVRERPVRTGARAVRLAKPGAVVCFGDGRYPTLRIVGVEGTAEAPIVFRSAPGERAVFSMGQLALGHGALIQRATHVRLQEVDITQVQTGVAIVSSHHVRVEGVHIATVGQAGIQVRRAWNHDGGGFAGPASHHVDLVGNRISDTGWSTARYGEGIYIGSGGNQGDDTHDVLVEGNVIAGTRAEAIELKPYAHHIVVRDNDVRGGSHFFHGAITVGAQAFDAPDMHAVIEGNRVQGFRSIGDEAVGGIVVGHGTTVVRNNRIVDIDGPGIRTTTTFANSEASDVHIEGNTITGCTPPIALHAGDERTGMLDGRGRVTVVESANDTVAR